MGDGFSRASRTWPLGGDFVNSLTEVRIVENAEAGSENKTDLVDSSLTNVNELNEVDL